MSSSNGTTVLGPARGYEFDIDGIDFPRPAYAPTVWLCIGEPGKAAERALNHWLKPPQPTGATASLVDEPDEPHPSDSLALLRRITRVITLDNFAASDAQGVQLYTRLKTDLEAIMSASELRGGWRDDIIVPHLWIVCDLSLDPWDLFFTWLDAALSELRKDDIVCRTTVVARFARAIIGDVPLETIKLRMYRLAERVLDIRSNLSASFRLLVVSDRDRRGSLFVPRELANAIGHFAEFVLLAKAPGAISSAIIPLFRSRDTHRPVVDPWEHLPIFGSLWLTRIQIKESDAKLRINPKLRVGISEALTAPPTPFWVPETPVFDRIDLARNIRWPMVDLPTWRTLNWEEAPEETKRFAIELDRWLEAATYWRRLTLATYVEFGENIRRHAIRSTARYWQNLDHLGALVLNDPRHTGGIDLLDRLVARAIIEIETELAAFPKLTAKNEPENRRLPPIRNDVVQRLVPEPTVPLGNALETLARRIVRRVHPPQLVLLTIICAFMIWHWTVISIRHWDTSGFGWIGRQDLPFKIRDPILIYVSERAQQLRDWLAPTPIGSISMMHWILIALILGAIVFDLLVLMIDRWGVHRAVRRLRKRTQTWIDHAHHELPALLAHRETVINKRELELINEKLLACQKRLKQVRTIAESHGVVPLAPDTVFSANIRLASPAFAVVSDADIQTVSMGIRHALAASWREVDDRAFVQIVLDQEEPVTARGGRAVHDPRAELKPLIDMIEARMPNHAHILVPPMFSEPEDLPGTNFSRIVSLPAHSREVVHDTLFAKGYDDLIVIAHEPERVAFVVCLELDVPAKTIFGNSPIVPDPGSARPSADAGPASPEESVSDTGSRGEPQSESQSTETDTVSSQPRSEDVAPETLTPSDEPPEDQSFGFAPATADEDSEVASAAPVDATSAASLSDISPANSAPADLADAALPATPDSAPAVTEESDPPDLVDAVPPSSEHEAVEDDSIRVEAAHDELVIAPEAGVEDLPVVTASHDPGAIPPEIDSAQIAGSEANFLNDLTEMESPAAANEESVRLQTLIPETPEIQVDAGSLDLEESPAPPKPASTTVDDPDPGEPEPMASNDPDPGGPEPMASNDPDPGGPELADKAETP